MRETMEEEKKMKEGEVRRRVEIITSYGDGVINPSERTTNPRS